MMRFGKQESQRRPSLWQPLEGIDEHQAFPAQRLRQMSLGMSRPFQMRGLPEMEGRRDFNLRQSRANNLRNFSIVSSINQIQPQFKNMRSSSVFSVSTIKQAYERFPHFERASQTRSVAERSQFGDSSDILTSLRTKNIEEDSFELTDESFINYLVLQREVLLCLDKREDNVQRFIGEFPSLASDLSKQQIILIFDLYK
mmetsp:Transcript_3877/g.6593  ORF Transcript_3877/g.6593 Transcript_3877/m.6593 type:complete len:199 (+) Transcript_3877:844-1440(+)